MLTRYLNAKELLPRGNMRNALLGFLVVAAGCGADPGASGSRGGDAQSIVEDNIVYRAETLIMESFPVQLRANVHITNLRSAPVTVTFRDGCLVYLRVYRDAARTSLAYDSEKVEGCTDALVPVSVGAGQSKTVSARTISAADILGDSLPNGTYYFSAVVRPETQRITLHAGSAALAR